MRISMKSTKYLCLAVLGFCIGFYTGKAYPYDENGNRYWLAMNLYFEAGNQSDAGRLAVGYVTLNRVMSVSYPDTIQEVVQQGPTYTNWKGSVWPVKHQCQFSWYCDGKKDIPEDSKTWEECLVLADILLNTYNYNYDFTEGATHYHNDTVHPYWADHLAHVVTIDNHIFYK
jgi:spore germination cell wall hydrolase CwlJ-like protein